MASKESESILMNQEEETFEITSKRSVPPIKEEYQNQSVFYMGRNDDDDDNYDNDDEEDEYEDDDFDDEPANEDELYEEDFDFDEDEDLFDDDEDVPYN